jgi:hypothetical protein
VATDDDQESLQESLAEAFLGVARQLRDLSRQTLEPWGVTPGQFRALGVLMQHSVMLPGEPCVEKGGVADCVPRGAAPSP